MDDRAHQLKERQLQPLTVLITGTSTLAFHRDNEIHYPLEDMKGMIGTVVTPDKKVVFVDDDRRATKADEHDGEDIGRWRLFGDKEYLIRVDVGPKLNQSVRVIQVDSTQSKQLLICAQGVSLATDLLEFDDKDRNKSCE